MSLHKIHLNGLIYALYVISTTCVYVERRADGDKRIDSLLGKNYSCTAPRNTFYNVDSKALCIKYNIDVDCHLWMVPTNEIPLLTVANISESLLYTLTTERTNLCPSPKIFDAGKIFLQSSTAEEVWLDRTNDGVVTFENVNNDRFDVRLLQHYPGRLLKVQAACVDSGKTEWPQQLCAIFRFSGNITYNTMSTLSVTSKATTPTETTRQQETTSLALTPSSPLSKTAEVSGAVKKNTFIVQSTYTVFSRTLNTTPTHFSAISTLSKASVTPTLIYTTSYVNVVTTTTSHPFVNSPTWVHSLQSTVSQSVNITSETKTTTSKIVVGDDDSIDKGLVAGLCVAFFIVMVLMYLFGLFLYRKRKRQTRKVYRINGRASMDNLHQKKPEDPVIGKLDTHKTKGTKKNQNIYGSISLDYDNLSIKNHSEDLEPTFLPRHNAPLAIVDSSSLSEREDEEDTKPDIHQKKIKQQKTNKKLTDTIYDGDNNNSYTPINVNQEEDINSLYATVQRSQMNNGFETEENE